MRIAIAILSIVLFSSLCFSATIYVPDNFALIQDAINASSNGDTVIVRAGTYKENLLYNGKAITVTSESGPERTIIDANGSWVVIFRNGENASSVLNGFALTGGTGGILCDSASPVIRNNIITGNTGTSRGGGIYCQFSASPTIENNTICYNSAGTGGGIHCFEYCNPYIFGNYIFGNTATGYMGGGGIGIYWDSFPKIVNNVIASNKTSGWGGGIWSDLSRISKFTSNTICNNVASGYGGGLCYSRSSISPFPMEIANTVFWDNSALNGPEIYAEDSDFSIHHSDVYGGQSLVFVSGNCSISWGSGMIDLNPQFADLLNDDFHLTWASPCRNTGDTYSSTHAFDFEGDPRHIQGTVDIGADEFYYHLYSVGDVLPGSPIDLKVVGIPGLPALLALGAGTQDPPQSTQHGDLWLTMPLAKTWQLGPVPSTGILTMNATVPSGWPSGSQHPFQALVGPWGGGATKLTNSLLIEVE